MDDRFRDDNFTEAARVYQNIKAPSDLRERVLKAATEQTQAAAERSGTVQLPERRKMRTRGKLYRAASLAACLAIMLTVLPDWMPDMAADSSPDVTPRGVIGEDTLTQPDEGCLPGIDLAREESGIPVTADTEGDSVLQKPENEPRTAEEPVKPDEPSEPMPVYEVRSEVRHTEAEPTDDEEAAAAAEAEKEEEPGKTGIAIPVGKLLPAMAAEGSVLQNMEVRLIEVRNGTCTVEIITADSRSAEITVAKNAEDGYWEIIGATEE